MKGKISGTNIHKDQLEQCNHWAGYYMEEVIEKLKVLPKKARKRKIVSNYYLNPLVSDVQALKG